MSKCENLHLAKLLLNKKGQFTMDRIFRPIADYIMTQSLQIAAVFAVITALCFLFRRRTSHVRYLLWLLVLAKCIMPSLVTVSLAILPQPPNPD